MQSFEVVIHGELFRISERTQPGGAMSWDFAWLNGPAEGTYGFTIGQQLGRTAAAEEDAETLPAGRMSAAELVAAADGFVKSFYEPGGIGETDFPNHAPANAGSKDNQ